MSAFGIQGASPNRQLVNLFVIFYENNLDVYIKLNILLAIAPG